MHRLFVQAGLERQRHLSSWLALSRVQPMASAARRLLQHLCSNFAAKTTRMVGLHSGHINKYNNIKYLSDIHRQGVHRAMLHRCCSITGHEKGAPFAQGALSQNLA
jgi:hypothetical protein